jgi:hypothetical protein
MYTLRVFLLSRIILGANIYEKWDFIFLYFCMRKPRFKEEI